MHHTTLQAPGYKLHNWPTRLCLNNKASNKADRKWLCAQDAHVHSFHFDDQYYTYHRCGTEHSMLQTSSYSKKLVCKNTTYCMVWATVIYECCQKLAHGTAHLPSNLCQRDVAVNHSLELAISFGLTSLTAPLSPLAIMLQLWACNGTRRPRNGFRSPLHARSAIRY